MRLAAILGILACGLASALWLRTAPVSNEAGAAAVAGLIAGSLPCGLLTGGRRHRILLAVGLAVLSAALWLGLPSPVLGLGGGLVFASANTVVWVFRPGPRGAAMSFLNLPFPVGLLFATLIPLDRLAYAAASTATLALAIAVVMPMPRPASPRAASNGAPATLLLALILLLYMVCEGGIWHGLAWYLKAAKVVDSDMAMLIQTYGFPLGLLVGRVGTARLLANLKPQTLARFTSCAMVFAAVLMLLARTPSAAWMGVVSVGIAMSPLVPSVLALAAERSGLVLGAAWVGLAMGWSTMGDRMIALPLASLAMVLVTYVAARTFANRPAAGINPGAD